MRERTSNKALPRQKQQRRNNEAMETMGNLHQKKQRPPKNFSQTRRPHMPTFWEKLILNWHNYSLPQKIAVITAGLVLSGVAIYLAVGLAQSVYANMSAELDTPHKTREPSLFTQIDRALSFPVASAAPTPQKNKIHELFPEFDEGTDQHEKPIKKEMEKGFRAIHEALYSLLQTPSEKSKVVALFETQHTEALMFKNLLFAYLKLFSNTKKSDVTVVKEFISTPDDHKTFKDYYNQMVLFNTAETLTRDVIETNLERLCFNHHPPTLPMQQKMTGLLFCEMQNIALHGFKLVLAYRPIASLNMKAKIEIYSLNKGVTYSLSSHFTSIRKIEGKVISETIQTLSASHPNDIIIVIGGGFHAKPIYDALKNSTHPFRALFLDTETKAHPERDRITALTQKLSRACIMHIKDCPPEVQAKAKQRTIDYCVDNTPYTTEKKCDTAIHQELLGSVERIDFNLFNNDVAHIPATLPQRYPEKITDFFAPKSSMKMLEAKLAQDKIEPEKQENNRIEL